MTTAKVVVAGLEAKPEKVGHLRMLVTDLLCAGYATGGDSLTPADLGFTKIHAMVVQRQFTTGLHGAYDPATAKFMSFTAAGAESANGAFPGFFRVIVYGI